MKDEFSNQETPVLCKILRQLHDAGTFTEGQLADLLNIADAYPYLSRRDMDFAQVRTVFRHAPTSAKPAVQRALLESLTDGEGWLFERIDGLRDIARDGVVDTNDVIDGGLKALDKVGHSITIARKESGNGRKHFMPGRAEELRATINQAIRHLLEVQQVVSFLDKQDQRTRRSA